MKFVTAYGLHDPKKFGIDFTGEVSLTHQSMAADCDINNIMKRFEKTGVIDHVREHGDYGDFLEATDYHTSMLKVLEAQEMFAALPAAVRAKFENDPGQFLSFVHEPSNRREMAEMGLLDPEVAQEVLAAETPPVPNSEAVRSET